MTVIFQSQRALDRTYEMRSFKHFRCSLTYKSDCFLQTASGIFRQSSQEASMHIGYLAISKAIERCT